MICIVEKYLAVAHAGEAAHSILRAHVSFFGRGRYEERMTSAHAVTPSIKWAAALPYGLMTQP